MKYIIKKITEKWSDNIASIELIEFPENGDYNKLLYEGTGIVYICTVNAINILAKAIGYEDEVTSTIEEYLYGNVITSRLFKILIHNPMEGNAIEVLRHIVGKRNWYNGLYHRATADYYKKAVRLGKIEYSTAVNILTDLGYEIAAKEIWVRNK
jgi:hypothetical protein